MSDKVVQLSFPAKPDYLLLARLALAGLARSFPVGDEELADLKLAVTEACGNAVRHAYEPGEGSVEVAFVVSDERLEMFVEDRGVGITLAPPHELRLEPTQAEPTEGGMGMAIIRAVVDELEVKEGSNGRGTVVHMTKYLAPSA
jgi:serine/threonine-protein kinase RsbW